MAMSLDQYVAEHPVDRWLFSVNGAGGAAHTSWGPNTQKCVARAQKCVVKDQKCVDHLPIYQVLSLDLHTLHTSFEFAARAVELHLLTPTGIGGS